MVKLPRQTVNEVYAERDQLKSINVDLLTALKEIAKPDGLTEASAGAMVFKDLESKKKMARTAIAKARAT